MKENIRFRHTFQNTDLITILLFLPNMHFWTVSFGKGSFIFLGLALAAYGMSDVIKRKLALLTGLLLVYHVRPHVFLFMVIGIVFGFVTGRQKIPAYQKMIVFIGCAIAGIVLYNKILAFANLDSENVVDSFQQFSTTRSYELSKSAGSGLDTSNYPLWLKLITFWFRPLFFDAPGILGLIVSVENLFYVIIASSLLKKNFFKFLRKSSAVVKSSLVIFIVSSIALSSTMSNLGIIIRQKSMVMYFFFFVILSFMDYEKMQVYIKKKRKAERKKRLEQQTLGQTV
ncbi:MAG: hypothetical protein J0I41_20200 [Filimonas sp.]|nr:hypothetical protein [Filimonas sp.]